MKQTSVFSFFNKNKATTERHADTPGTPTPKLTSLKRKREDESEICSNNTTCERYRNYDTNKRVRAFQPSWKINTHGLHMILRMVSCGVRYAMNIDTLSKENLSQWLLVQVP